MYVHDFYVIIVPSPQKHPEVCSNLEYCVAWKRHDNALPQEFKFNWLIQFAESSTVSRPARPEIPQAGSLDWHRRGISDLYSTLANISRLAGYIHRKNCQWLRCWITSLSTHYFHFLLFHSHSDWNGRKFCGIQQADQFLLGRAFSHRGPIASRSWPGLCSSPGPRRKARVWICAVLRWFDKKNQKYTAP